MDQTRAQTALAPFVALAKSANSPRAAADLVTQATSATGTYIFAELLAQPNVSQLKSDKQHGNHHRLLEIFSWGSWETYKQESGLPQLNDNQKLKLRLLSLLSYAAEKDGDLSYHTLSKRLDLASSVDLEHLVTTAIYSNLLTATLNPAEQIVLITSVAPLRDPAPGSVQSMLAELDAWSDRCHSVQAELEAEIAKIKADASKRAAREAKLTRQLQAADEASEKHTSGGDRNRGALGSLAGNARNTRPPAKRESPDEDDENDADAMDIDTPSNGTGGKKKVASIFNKFKAK